MAPKKRPRSSFYSNNFFEKQNLLTENNRLDEVKKNLINCEKSLSTSPFDNLKNTISKKNFDAESFNGSDSMDLIFGSTNLNTNDDLLEKQEKRKIQNEQVKLFLNLLCNKLLGPNK